MSSHRRRQDAPRVDAASLPAAGTSSARRILNTEDERRLKDGSAPTHYTFVDGAIHERLGGRRPPPRGAQAVTTRVHECLGRPNVETSNERSVDRGGGRRAPPLGSQAVTTRVHECIGRPNVRSGNERSVDPGGGRRAPPHGALTTRVHECLGRSLDEPSNERSVAQHFTIVDGDIPTARARGGRRPLQGPVSVAEHDNPRQGRAHVAMTTSVGRVMRQEPLAGAASARVEHQRLIVRHN